MPKALKMKISKSLILSFLLLIALTSLYRIMPNRPYGFAPQIAIALFAGSIIKDKKFAFLLPLLSMFISDVLYEILYINGVGNIAGFYEGQITNYLLFVGLTVFGFFIKNFDLKKIGIMSLAAPTTYFILSNFFVWLSPGAGLGRPTDFSGLMMTYADGLPFYAWSIASTVIFSAILFGSYYYLFAPKELAKAKQ